MKLFRKVGTRQFTKIIICISWPQILGSGHTDLCQLTGAQKHSIAVKICMMASALFQRERIILCVQLIFFRFHVALTNVHVLFSYIY